MSTSSTNTYSIGRMLMTRPRAPWSSKRTRPLTFAKIVSSLPRPALSPGRKRRPRCRTMMVPPLTRLPSCALTPSRCEFESRPLRELPCPFLCAIAESCVGSGLGASCDRLFSASLQSPAPTLALNDDVGNPHARVDRAVSFGPAHALASLLLEHANLRTARLALDDGVDLRVGHKRGAGEHLAAVLLDEQHLFERHVRSGFGNRAGNHDERARRHSHLMRDGPDDCVHSRHLCKRDILPAAHGKCKAWRALGGSQRRAAPSAPANDSTSYTTTAVATAMPHRRSVAAHSTTTSGAATRSARG